ncbi:MAG: ATP-sensitive inward rectifier potassium channel 10 [Deltaproteobacteria bacterium]|nr:ATP-sensitive inward rectifier potassium channel 10 [Deltaproteobacteria bacterium]
MAVTGPAPSANEASPATPRIVIHGERRKPLRDLYHWFLIRPWRYVLGAIAGGFMIINLTFAVGFWLTGGVANSTGFVDDLFFSVQTAGTIGYGAMYPASRLANALVVGEAVASLITTALATGLVFAKFSRSTARMRFSKHVCITPINGMPTLTIRIGNERGNAIVEATIHVTLSRTEVSAEGERFYRQYDLPLTRERAPVLSRTWTVMHPLTEWSQLAGATPESLAKDEAEILVSITGIDDTSMQTAHARTTYEHGAIRWGMRHADILSETATEFIVDLTKFDDVVATAPTPTFPYPRAG